MQEVDDYIAARAAEAEASQHLTKLKELVVVAEHTSGDAKAAEQARADYLSQVWAPSHRHQAETAGAMFRALGLTRDDIFFFHANARRMFP